MESTHPRHRIVALVALLLVVGAAGGYLAWRRLRNPADEPPADALRTDRSIAVEVENASGRHGLARQVTRLLRERGLDVVDFSSDDSTIAVTQVLVRRGPASAGQEVARALGAGVVTIQPDSLRRLDVTVRLGRDYRLPPGRPPF